MGTVGREGHGGHDGHDGHGGEGDAKDEKNARIEAERRASWRRAEEAAAEVATWPWWKKGDRAPSSSGMPRPTAHERIIALLRERSYEKKRVTLASGRESDFFIDCKQTVLTAEGHRLVGVLMLDAIDSLLDGLPPCEAVAGVELGGCPLASAVALMSTMRTSAVRERPLDALYVRKEVKDHGSKRLVEGDKSLVPGTRVVLLEDVITTGASTLKAAEKLRGAGAAVVGVVALVDRQEGGAEAIRAAGFPLVSICTRSDFP